MKNIKITPTLKFEAIWLVRSLVLLLMSYATHSQAANLQDIQFRPLDQDRFEIVLQLDNSDFPDPQVFAIEQPARLVLDLPEVINQVSEKRFTLSLDNADEAILLGTAERTRLVVNLNRMSSYETLRKGSQISFIVDSNSTGPTDLFVAPQVSGAQGSQTQQSTNSGLVNILDLDFRRGEEGEGNLVFEFDDDKLNTDVTLQGNKIQIRFFGAVLDERIRRVFDVVDFATPVAKFSAQTFGDESVIDIETLADFDYLAYQADNSYVISVKPVEEDEAGAAAREFQYTGEKLSLNFQDIEIRAVLQLIADFTELNLVASDTVAGSITLRLQNVPWDQALEIVLKAKGLDQRLEGNVLLVAPIEEIAERERLEIEANQQLQELAPLITEYIRIRYADAVELYDLLSGSEGSTGEAEAEGLFSGRGVSIVDSRTNTIIITDTASKIASFKSVVEQLDIPIRQVLIEARIVIANSDFRRELGVRWGGTGVNFSNGGDSVVQYGNSISAVNGDAINVFNGTSDLVDDSLAVDLGVASATSSFAVSFLTDSAFVDLELSALENEGFGEVVSQPKVLTGDKQTAFIKSGSEIAYQEASASGATAVQFREAVLELAVTPQITPDDRVILDLNVSQDSIGEFVFEGVPTIDITELQTQVLVDNGETLVLGGIFQMTTTDSVNKVPVLGDIPIIGNAFKNTITAEEKQELLIFITPKILDESYSAR